MSEPFSASNNGSTLSEHQPVTQLIAAMKLGDEEAARKLFQLYRRRVAGLARKILPARADPADVSDVVQHVFAAVFVRARNEKLDPGPERQGIVNRVELQRYLLAVACHSSIRRATKIAHSPVNVSDLEHALSQRSDQDIQSDIRDVIEHLKVRLATEDPVALQVFVLTLTQSLTQKEISEQLNCSVSTVERKLAKIRAIWRSETNEQ